MQLQENKEAAAFPVHADTITRTGLTKRELIASMAMQGLMAVNEKGDFDTNDACIVEAAKLAVFAADALLKELEK